MLRIIPVITIFLIIGLFFIRKPQKPKNPEAVIYDYHLKLEIADNFLSQNKGLSDRQNLPDDTGMLFVFPHKSIRTFWMKNMNFPLDIIWIDDSVISGIVENAPPEGKNPTEIYQSPVPVNYVLEVNAGFAKKWNLKAGDKIRLNL